MFTVLNCVWEDHDLRLVLLAALICVVSAVTAFRFHLRSKRGATAIDLAWMGLTGIVAGCGVWATHFIAMVAYDPRMPIHYELAGTALSLAPAVIGMGLGFAIAARFRGLPETLLGGAVTGASIAAMHYTGIAAVRVTAVLQWDWGFVIASVVMGCLGGMAAFYAARRARGLRLWILPPTVLVLGIVGLHFTSMAAITLLPDPTLPEVTEVMSRGALAGITGGIAFLIILAAISLFLMEARTKEAGLKSVSLAFSAVPSGLALFDTDERLVLWNPAYETLVGRYGVSPSEGASRREIIGRIINAGHGYDGVTAAYVTLGAEKLLSRQAQEWRQPDGRWLRAEQCAAPEGGTITILSDVTDVHETAEAMAEARDKAEAASRMQSEFLANMSHEIRTPLNGVLGMAQVMEADELSAAQRARLKVVRESGAALMAILNDVLDLSKVQAGQMELASAPFCAVDLANSLRAGFEGQAAAKDLTIRVEADPVSAGCFLGDPLRLRQILSNLIANAVKFSHDGEIVLEVRDTGDGVAFTVRDNGIGIAEEHLQRLFDTFSQVDSSMTRPYGGAGMGLAISRGLAALMGGDIRVESVLGEGSSFTLSVPLCRAEPDAAPVRDPGAAPPQAFTLLAAEDNPVNQLVLRALLAPLGIELTLAGNGLEALEAFRSGTFDAVLLDIQMPEMNGIDAAQAMRRLEAAEGRARTPILALTANVMTHQVAEYLGAGMDGCVAKPLELAALLDALDAALTPPAKAA